MISDVLHDAIEKIKRYQRDFPDCYRPLEPQINDVLRVMDRLRAHLDLPPSPTNEPPGELLTNTTPGVN